MRRVSIRIGRPTRPPPPSRSKPCSAGLGGRAPSPCSSSRPATTIPSSSNRDSGVVPPARSPRPPEGRPLLLRRPEPLREARQPRKAAPPRAEDEVVFRAEHLARTLHGARRMRGHGLRGGASEGLLGRDAPEGPGARRSGQPRAFLPIVVGTLILVEVERLCPGARGGASRSSCGCGGTAPKGPSRTSSSSGRLMSVEDSIWSIPSACSSRPSDGAPPGCATPGRPTGGRGWCWRPSPSSGWRGRMSPTREAGVGKALLRARPPDADPGRPRGFGAFFGAPGDARQAAETLREIAREAQRAPLGSGQTLSGHQEERPNPLKTSPSDLLRRT